MKLMIFGATGTVGRFLVDQARAQHHHVTAFARRPEKLGTSDATLNLVAGDVLEPASVERAIAGHYAVLCALGKPLVNRDYVRAHGTKNIVQAMEEIGVPRLVCLSGLGAGDSWDILPFHYKYLIFPLMMRRLYADHERQERYVEKSDLDWIIVRPGSFSKGARTGAYRHGFTTPDKTLKLKIAPADVADFMLSQVNDDTYLRQAPCLSY